MKHFYRFAAILTLLAGCDNLEDAELTERKTFVRFYEGAHRYVAAEAIETSDGGYLVAGTVEISGSTPSKNIWVTKTNALGIKQWDQLIGNGQVSALKKVNGGYAIIGDKVILSPNFSSIDDFENTSSRLIIIGEAGNILQDHSYAQTANNKHIDYRATSMTIDNDENFVTLGTRKHPDEQEKAVITAVSRTSFDTLWQQTFDYINRDYTNARGLYYDNGKILWGSSITESVNNFTKSYLSIPVIMENSTFVNSNYFGQDNTQSAIKIKDLKQYALGYAAVGTYSETNGSNANMFFITIDNSGNFKTQSIRYYDAASSTAVSSPSASVTEDEGEAITPTRDGNFVLAGSSVNMIRGGKDIWLLKINRSGEVLWSKMIGGRYNERVSSITEGADGSLIICGTSFDGASEEDGLASIFLIKTDFNGDLNN